MYGIAKDQILFFMICLSVSDLMEAADDALLIQGFFQSFRTF